MKPLPWFVLLSLLTFAPIRCAAQSPEDHPDRQVQPGVPQGKITSGVFSDSRIFPGTRRDYSVYVPAQYQEDQPANLMVFMDGSGYAKPDGAFRVPVVFDNLIHQTGDAGDDRRVRQSGHDPRDQAGCQGPQQPIVRIRFAGRPLRAAF